MSAENQDRFTETGRSSVAMLRGLRDTSLANMVRILAIVSPGALAASLAFMASSNPAATTTFARLGLAAFAFSSVLLLLAIYYSARRREKILINSVRCFNAVVAGEMTIEAYENNVLSAENFRVSAIDLIFWAPAGFLAAGFALIAIAIFTSPTPPSFAPI